VSIYVKDYISLFLFISQTQLSGFLLRKFKSSPGWQRLWVVLSGYCLFFYKSFDDELPLASLPLPGYSISLPTETDLLNNELKKDFVFKLVFKTHVYFFRAEDDHQFERWMECIRTVSMQALN